MSYKILAFGSEKNARPIKFLATLIFLHHYEKDLSEYVVAKQLDLNLILLQFIWKKQLDDGVKVRLYIVQNID